MTTVEDDQAMLKSNLFDLPPIDEGLEVDNLWILEFGLMLAGKEEGGGAVSKNRVPDNRF